MLANDGTEPVADDEILYRRIPVSMGWYSEDGLSPEAFGPTKHDNTGISISRAKYKSLEDAANGKSRKGYYVAVLRAGDLTRNGIRVEPRPLPDDSGHAELPDVNYGNRAEDQTQERKVLLKNLTLEVQGPFLSKAEGAE